MGHSDSRPSRLHPRRPRPTTKTVSKPFRFRLERVRELREHDEDRAREDLAASLGAQVRGESMLHAATLEVAQAQSARRDGVLSGGPVACIDLHAHQLWAERLQRQRADAELALERAGAEVDARRSALVEASRRREVLERLKERRRREHRAEMERVEGAQLDEMALTGFLRRRRASGRRLDEHRRRHRPRRRDPAAHRRPQRRRRGARAGRRRDAGHGHGRLGVGARQLPVAARRGHRARDHDVARQRRRLDAVRRPDLRGGPAQRRRPRAAEGAHPPGVELRPERRQPGRRPGAHAAHARHGLVARRHRRPRSRPGHRGRREVPAPAARRLRRRRDEGARRLQRRPGRGAALRRRAAVRRDAAVRAEGPRLRGRVPHEHARRCPATTPVTATAAAVGGPLSTPIIT